MVGPPISIFSMASASEQSGFATVFSNGYKLTTTKSIGVILLSAITASSVPRRAKMPPCIFGCKVFTRPSIISGKPVWAETSVTLRPLSFNSLYVPPVESISIFRALSCWANSTIPVLSETLISARRTAAVG